MRFEGFPDHAGIVSNAAVGVKTRVVTRSDGGVSHGQEIRQLFERDEGAATAEILGVERATAAGQFVLPAPEHLEMLVEDDARAWVAAGDGGIQGREWDVRHREKHAEAGGVNE